LVRRADLVELRANGRCRPRLCKNAPHDMLVTRFSGGGRERLEREAGRNVEVMWLTGRLVPDHGQ